MGANSLKWELLIIKKLYKCRSTNPKKIRRLLSGEGLRLGQDTYGKTSLQGVNYLEKNSMNLLWNLHLVTRYGACQEVARNWSLSTVRLMRRKKIMHSGDAS